MEFNVLDYSHNELYSHLLRMCSHLNVLNTLNITPSQMLDFIIDVDKQYNDILYHSFYHAVDIVTVLYYTLVELKAEKYFTALEISILLLSSLCHDAGHPGYNNEFQVKLKTDLALRFNNTSVLESLSVEIAFKLLRKHCLFKEYREDECLNMVKHIILATDMEYHYELLDDEHMLEDAFQSVDTTSGGDSEIEDTITDTPPTNGQATPPLSPHQAGLTTDQRLRFASILIHAADISNTVKIWPLCKQWSDLIVEEFFLQGDAEKAAHIPVSPGMDRDLATQASISLKFSDYIVKPYYEGLARLLPSAKVYLDILYENRAEWMKLKDSPLSSSVPSPSPLYGSNGYNVSVPAGTILVPSSTSSPYVHNPHPGKKLSTLVPCKYIHRRSGFHKPASRDEPISVPNSAAGNHLPGRHHLSRRS
ncbi:hypothetical protein BDB01DRAFT_726827 [Pilobolus umbonatus]|nr:hypothetical protein BDB01DRAFT_726827 [Pilobolus umbonatus]